MTNLEKWKKEVTEAFIENTNIDGAVNLIISSFWDGNRCEWCINDYFKNRCSADKCAEGGLSLEHCKVGIKAYLDMEVEE